MDSPRLIRHDFHATMNFRALPTLRSALLSATCLTAFIPSIRAADPATQPQKSAPVPLPQPAKRKIDFVKDIQPIFAENCYGCHGPRKQEAQFRLDHKATALRGGELGPAIVPGKSAESLLIQFVGG